MTLSDRFRAGSKHVQVSATLVFRVGGVHKRARDSRQCREKCKSRKCATEVHVRGGWRGPSRPLLGESAAKVKTRCPHLARARSRFSDSYLCAGCVNGVCPLYDCWLGAQSGGRDSTLKAGRGTRPSSQGPSSQTQHPSCIHVSPIANPSYTGSGASFSFGSHPIAMH